jgi:hypothetical protein
VSAPCGLILEIWNLEQMQHVMQKNDFKNANKKQLQKKNAQKKRTSEMHKKCKCKNAMQNK